MEVTSALSSAAGNTPKPTGASAKLAESFDNFLKLLTTQLRYQDPLDPLSSTEFVTQLVQFTEVEQSISTNKNLEKLLALQTANQATGALGFIGRTVEAESDTGPLAGGKAEFTYSLDALAAKTTLVVFNSKGQVVFSTPGQTTTGKHQFSWDGLDRDGNQLPDGVYRLVVAARDKDDASVTSTTGVVARVTGVETTADGVLLSLGGASVPIDKVRSVIETPAQPGP